MTMPILSPVFAQRSAAAERLMAFAAAPLAHSRPPASHALSGQVARRLSVASAPGVLAGQIAQRYAPGEHAAAPIDLLLPFAPRPHQPATARWAGPRWPTTPLQRASAEPNAPAMPAASALQHDLAGSGWGDAQPQGGHDLPVPPTPAGGSELPLAQRLPEPQATPAGMRSARPAQPATLRRAPAVAQRTEEVARSADNALHIQTEQPVHAEQPGTTAAQPLPDATAPAEIARAAEPAATPFMREMNVPDANADVAPPGEEKSISAAPAGLVVPGQLQPASPPLLARTAELTLRPAALRPTALVSMRTADPLARMGFAPASAPGAPTTAARSIASLVAKAEEPQGPIGRPLPEQARVHTAARVARTSAPPALEQAPDTEETQQVDTAGRPAPSDGAPQDLALSAAIDAGVPPAPVARTAELPASAGAPPVSTASDTLAGELPLRRAAIVPPAAAPRTLPGSFAARVVQRVSSGNRPASAAASGEMARLPASQLAWPVQAGQHEVSGSMNRSVVSAQPGTISGELPIAAQRSFFAPASSEPMQAGQASSPAAAWHPTPESGRRAAPGENETIAASPAWPQPSGWPATEAYGATGIGAAEAVASPASTPYVRATNPEITQRVPGRAGSFGSLALAVQRSTSTPEPAYAQSSGGELELATPAALVAQHAATLVQRQAEPAPDSQPPAGNGPRGSAPAQAGAPPSPQQLEQIANQVYDHLRRRLLIDRERRGLW